MWITMLGVFLQRRVGRRSNRYVTMTGKGHVARALALGHWRWAALTLLAVYVLLADVLPFGALVLSSFMKYSSAVITPDILTLRQYADLFTGEEGKSALWNTVVLAMLSGSICVVLGLFISYLDVRHPGRWSGALAFVGVIPLAIPGVVYGVGLLWVYLRTPLYGTIWILLLAYVAKFVPFGIMVTRSGILQLHRELEESARTVGAGVMTVLWKIAVPLLKPVLIAVFFYIMLQSIKELSASALLYTQRGLVLSVLTWHHMDAGNYQFAAALGVVQTVMMIALVMITRAVFRVKLEKTFTG
jgi:iron(III) transport system permease protein